LYHLTIAAIFKAMAIPAEDQAGQVRVAQMVSSAAGIVILLVVLLLLRTLDLPERARFFAVALVALNPTLIGINAQATNDSFVYLFGPLSLYFGYRFFQAPKWRDFCAMTVAVVLAGLSKGNGLPLFAAVLAIFVLVIVRPPAACGWGRRDWAR